MVLTLYGNPNSTCTLRVGIILHEKGVPFVLKVINLMKGEHKQPEYLEKQPFGIIPYIDDDDFILYESRAICYYIAAKYANQGTPELIPTDLKANALFQQAASVELFNFNAYAERALLEKVFKPMYGFGTGDIKLADGLLATLETNLDVYEKILSKHKYLAGDAITLVDLYHIPFASYLPKTGTPGVEAGSRPNVARWWKDISSRPSWQAVKSVKGGNFWDN